MRKVLLLIALFTISYGYEPVGWLWYNEVKVLKKPKPKKRILSATDKMAKLQALFVEAINRAQLKPSKENIMRVIILQNFFSEMASDFSSMWQRVMVGNPSLNYAIRYPTQNSVQYIQHEMQNQLQKEAIANIAKNYGLFFFYRGEEKVDRYLAKTVKDFASAYKLALLAISVDGKLLEVFTNNKIDEGQAKLMNIEYFPALVLVNPKTRDTKILNYGFISYSELEQRVLQVANNFKGFY